MLFKALNKKDLTLLTNRRSQSALEYMMTYGWAILIIVIVAVILYSMGIFNPSSSITTTITGFQKTPVSSAIFTDNGGLSLSVQNSVGYPIKITNITATTLTGGKVIIEPNITLLPGKSQVLVLSKVFTAANQGSHISTAVTITYKETSQQLPGPYISTGSITGSTPTVIYPANYTFAAVSKLTITNKQSSATPSPFQQMVNITSADNGWQLISNGNFGQNVEFFYSNGTVIPSWLESYTGSNAIWWLKLGSIPAGSSITVYMGIASTSANLFNTVNDGEAPQIPCGSTQTSSCSNYAEYDDGANVFNFYDNFAGATLNTTKWSNVGSSGTSGSTSGITINNGLILTGGGTNAISHQTWIRTSLSSGSFNTALVADVYENSPSTSTTFRWGFTNSTPTYFGNPIGFGEQIYDDGNWYTDADPGSASTQNQIGSWASLADTYALWSIAATSSTVLFYNPNTYSNLGSAGQTITDVPSYSSSVGLSLTNEYTNPIYIKWVRVRAYPPNGVMPSVSFGSVA